jgi:alpha-ketoglutarate-dependent taurine dioxygenase
MDSTAETASSGLIEGEGGLPWVLKPRLPGFDLLQWARNNREWINQALDKQGGILFRGFDLAEVSEFSNFAKAFSGELLNYQERSSPRKEVGGQIYTSTEYPADQAIFLHNENSYQHTFPLRIFFYCVVPAQIGGETPIADMRKVYQKIPESVRRKFAEKGIMYVRNFGHGFGLSWEDVFQTRDRAEVERYCRSSGIDVEWSGNGCLRTRQVRPAITSHPRTKEMLWFNHGVFFHVSTLPPSIREALLRGLKEEELPSNTYYGDGSPIEASALELLREIHRQETVTFPWQKGDLLLLDNMLVSHGRNPFSGERRVVVAMAEPFSLDT